MTNIDIEPVNEKLRILKEENYHLRFRAKSGYVISAGLSWSPYTITDTEPWPVRIICSWIKITKAGFTKPSRQQEIERKNYKKKEKKKREENKK